MFSMATSILDNRASIGELSVLRPIMNQCPTKRRIAKDALFGTLNLALSQCYFAVSFFNTKMSDATMKGHNSNAALSAIVEFFKP
jgi:hypothetical protein